MEFFNDAKGDKYHSPEKQFFSSALPLYTIWGCFYTNICNIHALFELFIISLIISLALLHIRE